ncbi:hypothetical protein [Haloferula sp. BvORR071]|uniref:hypothetical protein n=1 Tax=Haloferula sp. BvORR071 TaxID=1396141 RepID=UPI002240FA88|nr:hypothetical protein [Haloferula sp. BvORR071]
MLIISAAIPLLSGSFARGAESDKPPAAEKETEATDKGADDFKLLAAESIGKIRHDQKAADLIKLYGEPKSKGKPEMWEAIGEWVEEWKYPALGVTVRMSSEKKDGPKKVLVAIAGKGCELATARGIKVGSTRAEVVKAYGDVQEKSSEDPPAEADKDQDKKDKEEESFVAGSIYGGLIFSFKDGKVSEILLGAAAE